MFFSQNVIPGVADYYATSVLMVLILLTFWLKRVKGVLLKLIIIQLLELSLVQMQEFMLRYFHCMTTFERTKIEGKIQLGSAVDAKIKTSLSDAVAKGGQVVLLTNTLASPSTVDC
jgi:molybdopterin-containing oxidoreductase family iron-sulfur binding subunit